MTNYFQQHEESTDSSNPIILFQFYTLDSDYNIREEWLYTNYYEDFIYDSKTYLAANISHSKIKITPRESGKLNITLDSILSFVTDHIIAYADDAIQIKMTRIQQFKYAQPLWSGQVSGLTINKDTSVISCDPGISAFKRPMLIPVYSVQCSHVLYGNGCNLDREGYKLTGTVSAIDGLIIYADILTRGVNADGVESDVSSGYYRSGMIETSDGQMRTIQLHYGTRATIVRPFRNLSIGDTIYVYPGCDHLISTCSTKFGNELNYGGYPYMPDNNPYSGDGIDV